MDEIEKLYTTSQIAEKLQIKPNALTIWRHRGVGPKYIKLSKRAVRYRKSDVLAFLEAKELGG